MTADEMFRGMRYRPEKYRADTVAYSKKSKSYDDEVEKQMIVVFKNADVVRKTFYVDDKRIGNSPWNKNEIRAVAKLLEEMEEGHGKDL